MITTDQFNTIVRETLGGISVRKRADVSERDYWLAVRRELLKLAGAIEQRYLNQSTPRH